MRPRRPLQPEERQRYWRRRANRRVRTSRLKRSAVRGLLVLAANVAVGGILLYAGTTVVSRVIDSPEFRVDTIRVDGAVRSDAARLRDALAALRGRNLIELDLRAVEVLVERDPWIREAAVRRVLPDTLHVSVAERQPAAVAGIEDGVYVVDRDGHVVGPAGDADTTALPLLSGLDGVSRDDLPAAIDRGIAALALLQATSPALADDLAELDLSGRDRLTARTRRPGPALYLDPQRVDRNVADYLALASVLHDRAGSMRYVDLRWDGRIAVMPNEEPKETR